MRKRKELQGLAIVDVTGGKKLGTVGDLVIDPGSGRLLALTLSGGVLGGGGRFVAVEEVRSFGPDAVTVEGDNVARPDSEMPDQLRAARDASSALVGKKVVTENGQLLGTVGDYLVDEPGRRVGGLIVSGGPLSGQDALAADRVVSLGPDAVIVTDADADVGEGRLPWTAGAGS